MTVEISADLIRILTGGRVTQLRPGQGALISSVLQEFWKGRRLVVLNAPPGSGKSVVALAVIGTGSAIISTSTTTLQDQYADYGLPTLKGRRWYRCSLLLPPLTAEHAPCAYDSNFNCPARRCEWAEERNKALNSPVTVVNHALLLITSRVGDRLVDRPLLVVDEAHRFVDDLCTAASAEVEEDLFCFLTGVRPAPDSWDERLNDLALPNVRAAAAKFAAEGQMGLAAVARRLAFVLGLFKTELVRKSGKIVVYPRNSSVLVSKVLSKFRVLAMSASITDHYVKANWGLEGFEYIVSQTRFPRQIRPIRYLPVAPVSYPPDPSVLDRLARAISALAKRHQGSRGVVHSVSSWLTDALAMRLRANHNGRIMVALGQERDRVLAEFFRTPGAILVSPSVSEGIDFLGDRARWQVIPKIPFPDASDPMARGLTPQQAREKASSSFVQAYGRGVRAPSDYCVTYVLDSNLSLIRSLLPEWVTEAITTCSLESIFGGNQTKLIGKED